MQLAVIQKFLTEEVEEVPAAEEEVKEVSTAQEATIVPTDEEVKLAYEKAREAYSWFDLTTMYSDGSSQTDITEIYM
mgnify:CR=1 FL=1